MRLQLRREWVIPAVVGVVSFATGIGASYGFKRFKDSKIEDKNFYFKNPEPDPEAEDPESIHVQLAFEFDDQIRQFNKAIAQVDHVIKKLSERGEVFLADIEAEALSESRDIHPANGEVAHGDATVVNIFPQVHGDDEDWNYALEVSQRDPEKPYIIHRDEFFDKEEDRSQTTLMYYEGDQILCDDRDTPIFDPDLVVGELIFGHGSKDPNVVYIRNEKFKCEYEVLRDRGYYQVVVLGEQLEEKDLKHSKAITKFRMD